jgi:hypothetical protein
MKKKPTPPVPVGQAPMTPKEIKKENTSPKPNYKADNWYYPGIPLSIEFVGEVMVEMDITYAIYCSYQGLVNVMNRKGQSALCYKDAEGFKVIITEGSDFILAAPIEGV